jgi:hypothetical protein
VTLRLDRNALEKLRDSKRSRNLYRLASSVTVEHEFRKQFGHPSSYAFVRFECAPADDLSFEVVLLGHQWFPKEIERTLSWR